jgi:hypothetical protein
VEADALEECVLGVRVHRALLVQDLLELVLLVSRLLPAGAALDSHDLIVSLALLGRCRVVPLAYVGVVVIVVFVVVALGQALVLLALLVDPSLHHVMKLYSGLGRLRPKSR